jgi:hypothetical protein
MATKGTSCQCFPIMVISFYIGTYYDRVLCDIVPMDVCHLLLGKPLQYDITIVYDGVKNTFLLEMDERKIRMIHMKEEKQDNNNNRNCGSG